MIKILFLLFSFTVWNLVCGTEIYLSKLSDPGIGGEKKEWQIFLDKSSSIQKIVFKEKKGHISFVSSDSVAHSFLRMAPMTFSKTSKLYIITVWSKGAHGETLKLVDPSLKSSEENNVVFHYHSAWPLTYQFENGELVITGASEIDQVTGVPIPQVVKFKP